MDREFIDGKEKNTNGTQWGSTHTHSHKHVKMENAHISIRKSTTSLSTMRRNSVVISIDGNIVFTIDLFAFATVYHSRRSTVQLVHKVDSYY